MIDEKKVTYQVERVAEVIEEIKPLLEAHWGEIALYRDRFPLRPDYGKYLHLDSVGMALVATVRAGGVLIGYAVYFIMPHLHYQDCRIAMNDILYIKPEHRRGRVGIRLLGFAEDRLRQAGVDRILQHVKTQHDFGRLLERIGYEETERTFEKLLG